MRERANGNEMNSRFGNGSDCFEIHIPTGFQLNLWRTQFYRQSNGSERHVIEENHINST